jgi:SiaC family regulatory phosphoprotein
MEQLIIEATNDTPKVHFNADLGELELSDRSLPENAIEFYQPLFEWIYNYIDSPNEETLFSFKLEYFSTSSAKQITKILFLLEKLSDTSKVKVNWYYKKEDIDMYSSGLKYSKLTNLEFSLIEN